VPKPRVKDRKGDVIPQNACRHAEQYFAAHKALEKYMSEINSRGVNIPNVVLMAFSVECFLKTILLLDKGSFLRSHNLIELFDDIGDENRKAISDFNDQFVAACPHAQKIKKKNPNAKYDIRTLLRDSAESFKDIRYMWENEHKFIPATFGWGLDGVLFALRKRILEIRPEWKEVMQPI
jgi:HEPN domain-containing protein